MAKNPIDRLIEAKEAKIASAERSIGKLKIEVAALREAREAVAESGGSTPHPNGKAKDVANERKKGRSISAQWKQVLTDIAHKGASGGVSLDELELLCIEHDIDLKRPTLRAQMSNYVKRGYLGRTGEGKFFIALHGLQVAGLETPPTGDAQVSGEGREETGTPR
jgi:hypothetical protein